MSLFYITNKPSQRQIMAGAYFTPSLSHAIEVAKDEKGDIYVFSCSEEMVSDAFNKTDKYYISRCHIRTNCCDKIVVTNYN